MLDSDSETSDYNYTKYLYTVSKYREMEQRNVPGLFKLTLTCNPNIWNSIDTYLGVRDAIEKIVTMPSLLVEDIFLLQEKHTNGTAHYHGYISFRTFSEDGRNIIVPMKEVDKVRGMFQKKIGRTQLVKLVTPEEQRQLRQLRKLDSDSPFEYWIDYIVKEQTEEGVCHKWTRPIY